MKKKLLPAIVLVAAIFGCSTKTSKESLAIAEKDSLQLVPIGTKVFALDSATSYETLYMNMYRDNVNGKQYLLYENRIKSTIQFYDYDTGVLFKEIALKKEGPDGVGKFRGFYVKSMDSIYVMSSKFYQFILVNGEGKVLKRYNLLPTGKDENDWSMPAIYTSTPPVVLKNKFYFVAWPESKPYEQKQPVLVIHLNDSATELLYSYPEVYQKGDYWGIFISDVKCATTGRETILYSFGADPYLYETDHAEYNKKHFAPSRYFDSTEPWDKKIADGKEEGYITRNYFRNILYDPYQNIYYRTTSLKLPLLNTQNERNTLWNKPMSIIILDKNFKKVGETLLKENLYDFRNWIVTEEGLLIGNSNPNNPELEEGKLKFTVFKLAPKQE